MLKHRVGNSEANYNFTHAPEKVCLCSSAPLVLRRKGLGNTLRRPLESSICASQAESLMFNLSVWNPGEVDSTELDDLIPQKAASNILLGFQPPLDQHAIFSNCDSWENYQMAPPVWVPALELTPTKLGPCLKKCVCLVWGLKSTVSGRGGYTSHLLQ